MLCNFQANNSGGLLLFFFFYHTLNRQSVVFRSACLKWYALCCNLYSPSYCIVSNSIYTCIYICCMFNFLLLTISLYLKSFVFFCGAWRNWVITWNGCIFHIKVYLIDILYIKVFHIFYQKITSLALQNRSAR